MVKMDQSAKMAPHTTWPPNSSTKKVSTVSSRISGLSAAFSTRWQPDCLHSKPVACSSWSQRFKPDQTSQLRVLHPCSQICLADCWRKIQWSVSHGSIYASIHSGPRKSMGANYPGNQLLTTILENKEMLTRMRLLSNRLPKGTLFQIWLTSSSQGALTPSDCHNRSRRTCKGSNRLESMLSLQAGAQTMLTVTFNWSRVIKSLFSIRVVTGKTVRRKMIRRILMIWQLILARGEMMQASCKMMRLSWERKIRPYWRLSRTRPIRSLSSSLRIRTWSVECPWRGPLVRSLQMKRGQPTCEMSRLWPEEVNLTRKQSNLQVQPTNNVLVRLPKGPPMKNVRGLEILLVRELQRQPRRRSQF